jgi:uncharacterized protein with PQ loop repeat
VAPIFTIPQALEVWVGRSAEGVSMITWTVYLINTAIWTVYGILHQERPIYLTFGFMTLLNLAIVVGVVVFS